MGLFSALPGRTWWNPLGTWAARLASALASIGVMLMLALAVPCCALALLREGESYGRSCFGYHNLQRFTHVVTTTSSHGGGSSW